MQTTPEVEPRSAGSAIAACRLARLGAWQWDAASRTLRWSAELCRIFALPAHETDFTAACLLARVDARDRPDVAAQLDGFVDGSGPVSFAYRLEGQDGIWRHCLCEGERVLAADGATLSITGYCQDVTARHQAEMLRHDAAKLEAVRQVTGSIAHDFNNMLTVISLNLEIAVDMLEQGDPLLDVLQPALKAAGGAAGVTERMLTFARRRPLHPARHDINAAVGEIVARARADMPDTHQVVLDLQDDVGEAEIDRQGLETALVNLLSNSREAMAQGGVITVRTETVRDETGPGIVISVADTGVGIPPELQRRVLEPFFTTRKGARGAGLGLNLAMGFVQHAGGRMTVESAPGVGTTVRLFLQEAVLF